MNLLTPQEVAAMTRLSPDTVQRRCKDGTLRATKPAGKWRIYPDSVEDWLRNSKPKEPGVLRPRPVGATVAGTRSNRAWQPLRAVEEIS